MFSQCRADEPPTFNVAEMFAPDVAMLVTDTCESDPSYALLFGVDVAVNFVLPPDGNGSAASPRFTFRLRSR